MNRAALYLRCSTSEQTTHSQIADLERYAHAHGWTIAARYEDVISGAKAERPALQQLLQDAHARKFDAVLVYKLDRFGRNVLHMLQNIQELDRARVRFVSVTQGIDTDQSNPAGRLFVQILGAVAEFERELTRERCRAGMDRAMRTGLTKTGNPVGRPKRVFDHARAREMNEAGQSIREIAREFGVSVGLVHARMKQPPAE